MTDPKNPPKPLLPYLREISFNPQVSTVADACATAPAGMPFYYASFVGIWVYWLTDYDKVHYFFEQGDFIPYVFTDDNGNKKALTVINYQTYTSHAGMALGTVNEVEFNVCAYPAIDEGRVPQGLSVKDFLIGVDQTKLIGLYRIHVPADNTIAVAAGRAFFGEPKFFAQFWYNIPDPNFPTQKTWDMYVFDSKAEGVVGAPKPPTSKEHMIFHLSVPEINAMPDWANTSPLALYTHVDGIPNGSHWQMLLPMAQYCPLDYELAANITMEAGDSPERSMAADIRALIGDSRPVGVQIFRSNPACIEGGAYEVGKAQSACATED